MDKTEYHLGNDGTEVVKTKCIVRDLYINK